MSFLPAARRIGLVFAVALAGSLASVSAAAERGAIEGYADYKTFAGQVEALAKPGVCEVGSLGTTLGGRTIFLITIGAGKASEKPAILVVGNVHAPMLFGSELAVRIARRLIGRFDRDTPTHDLLSRYTIYIIPRPSPDASEAFFQHPLRERSGNLHVKHDQRDPEDGKDPAADLNGDGLITMIRVPDETGRWRVSPDDARAMIPADPQKGQKGQYELYVEGRRPEEDDTAKPQAGGAGVAFNRNFSFRYPYYKPLAGPNAVSEIETRAVADFAFDHPNIAAVFSFSLEDNLMHPWKPAPEKGRERTSLHPEDEPEADFVAAKYRGILGEADAPAPPAAEGSFSQWAYFQYGRWSFAGRGWWIPAAGPHEKGGDAKPQAEGGADGKGAAQVAPDDMASDVDHNYGIDPLRALRWFDRENIDGFVPWTAIKHPDFPGQKVEVGGFKPFLLLNPPARLLDPLAAKHTDFVLELARLMPRVKLQEVRVEPLGAGINRITATVSNPGYLPTATAMGQTTEEVYPLLLRLSPPQGTQYVQGQPRVELGRIRGGGKTQTVWLIRLPEGKPGQATVTVSAPSVGADTATVDLK